MTPLTDSLVFCFDDLSPDEQRQRNGEYVDADFARQLGKELANAPHGITCELQRCTTMDGADNLCNCWKSQAYARLGCSA